MQSSFIEFVILILIILGLMMIANKFRVAYPIILVLGGLVVSFIPGFGKVTISPEVVFLSSCRRCYMKLPGKFPGKNSGNGAAQL